MSEKLKPVLDHKGRSICLNVSTGKFQVEGLDCGDLPDLAAAKKAVDAAVKAMLDVKRRPVIARDDRYSYQDEKDKWTYGELTSFSAHHWDRANLHANVVVNKERSEYDPENVYEDTPENRQHAKRVTAIAKEIAALETESEQLLTKTMVRITVPNLKSGEAS